MSRVVLDRPGRPNEAPVLAGSPEEEDQDPEDESGARRVVTMRRTWHAVGETPRG
eukprot:m.88056 g.88056  ORF g.88056 m.88056 type:complete len:55 (+) comp11612_c1_seq1:1-165(+)